MCDQEGRILRPCWFRLRLDRFGGLDTITITIAITITITNTNTIMNTNMMGGVFYLLDFLGRIGDNTVYVSSIPCPVLDHGRFPDGL